MAWFLTFTFYKCSVFLLIEFVSFFEDFYVYSIEFLIFLDKESLSMFEGYEGRGYFGCNGLIAKEAICLGAFLGDEAALFQV